MYFEFNNVNDAFYSIVDALLHNPKVIREDSRNGKVARFSTPLTVGYRYPKNLVLFDPDRDANPFFHFFEAMWMLSGSEKVGPLLYFIKDFDKYSDDGEILNGAYGHRWRKSFGYDQIDYVMQELENHPNTRRAYMGIWDPTGDLPYAIVNGKDVPCNVGIKFDLDEQKRVNMYVFNRSNDIILGMLGANYVHMSLLLWYVCACLRRPMGKYYQISTNAHVYLDHPTWKPVSYLNNSHSYKIPCLSHLYDIYTTTFEKATFQREVVAFVNGEWRAKYRSRILSEIGVPMMRAFQKHKEREYALAETECENIKAGDWRFVCLQWIRKRELLWEKKLNEKASEF
jgi:thymidylate synthase